MKGKVKVKREDEMRKMGVKSRERRMYSNMMKREAERQEE